MYFNINWEKADMIQVQLHLELWTERIVAWCNLDMKALSVLSQRPLRLNGNIN